MKIIQRHKDSTGRIVGYTVDDSGKQCKLDVMQTISLKDKITNAKLLSSGEFKAKAGCSIKTVIDYTGLAVMKNTQPSKVHGNTSSGIDYYGKEYINICRTLRRYANNRNIRVEMSPHKSNAGRNVQLFKLIKACGIDVETFVIGYLSAIQPYSLEHFMPPKHAEYKGKLWISDLGYKIKMVIKVDDTDKNKPIVISFHESVPRGKPSQGGSDFSDKHCAVLVDRVEQRCNGFGVEYTVQRGFIRQTIHSATAYYNSGVALVKFSDIKNAFDDTMTLVYDNMQKLHCNDQSALWSVSRIDTRELTFLALGFDDVNNIILLLDLYSKYTDKYSRAVLVQMAVSLISQIPAVKQTELKVALEEKYDIEYRNGLCEAVLENLGNR